MELWMWIVGIVVIVGILVILDRLLNKDVKPHHQDREYDYSEPVGKMGKPPIKRDLSPNQTIHNKPEPEVITITQEEYDNLKGIEASIDRIETTTKEMMDDNRKLKSQISDHNGAVKNMEIGYKDKITQLDGQVLDLQGKLNEELNSKNSGIKEVKDELGCEINKLELEVSGLEAEVRGKDGAIEGLNEEIRGLNDSVGAEGVDELKRENQMLRNENAMLKKKIKDIPSPELIKGRGVDEAEPVICDVCNTPFDDVKKLIAHCYGKKDSEHKELVKRLKQN